MKKFNQLTNNNSNYPFRNTQPQFTSSALSRQSNESSKKKASKAMYSNQLCQLLTQQISQAVGSFLLHVKNLYHNVYMHHLFNQLQVKRIIVAMTAPVSLKPDQFYSQYRDVGFPNIRESSGNSSKLIYTSINEENKKNIKNLSILTNQQQNKNIKKSLKLIEQKSKQNYLTLQKNKKKQKQFIRKMQQTQLQIQQHCDQQNNSYHQSQYNYINFLQNQIGQNIEQQQFQKQEEQQKQDKSRSNMTQKMQESEHQKDQNESNQNFQNIYTDQQNDDDEEQSYNYEQQIQINQQLNENQLSQQKYKEFNGLKMFNNNLKINQKVNKQLLEDQEQVNWWRRPIENEIRHLQFKSQNVSAAQQMQLGQWVFSTLQKKWSVKKSQIKGMARQLAKPQYQSLKTPWCFNYLMKNQAIRKLMQNCQAAVCASLAVETKPKLKRKTIENPTLNKNQNLATYSSVFQNEIVHNGNNINRMKNNNQNI